MFMSVTVVESDLDLKNLLSNEKPEYQHDEEHGWFVGGRHSYDWLLKFKVVKDWIDSYTAKNTRRQKLYQLEKVLAVAKITDPADLLKLNDMEAKNLIKRVSQYYLQQGKGSWARQIWITMRGFYEAHDREIKFKRQERIRVPPRKKVSLESIPLKPEVYRMADVANSLRNKTLVLCGFQSGVRPGCLVSWTYGMVEKRLYPEIQVPVQLRITVKEDSKLAGYGLDYYVTFLSQEAAESLKDYIEERKRNGWTPKKADYLFVPEASSSKNDQMSTGGLWEVIKSCAEKAGLNPEATWTHLLRKSFRKVLNATPTIPEDLKEALMGHRLPGSRGNYFDFHDVTDAAEKYSLADWTRNGNGGNGKLKALEEKNEELKRELAQARGDFGKEIRSLHDDIARVDEIARRAGDPASIRPDLEKLDRMRKEYEKAAKTFHTLTRMLAKRTGTAGKK
jgi:integrase